MSVLQNILDSPFPIVVKASAGTGKTYCLVEKIKDCVSKGVNPLNILTFTFTVDAANELKKRVQNGQLMTIGTMHAIMYQIIRENSTKRYFVLDNGAQNRFVLNLFKELKIDFDKAPTYMSAIGLAKNTFTDYYELINHSPQLLEEFFGDAKILSFAISYEAKKEHNHKIDFDDMTLKAFEILKNNPSILDSRQERWKYIFVDEAQDLCPPQIDIIRLLASKYKNLFVVGDEKQAIYASFRASTSQYIKDFTKEYPQAQEFHLPTTYRCSRRICNAGNTVAQMIDKSIIDTAIQKTGEIHIYTDFETQTEEAEFVCEKAIEYFNQEKTVKILYRTNAQSLTFQKTFLLKNIPYSVSQATSIFYTKEARVAIALCEMKYKYDKLPIENKIKILNALRPIMTNKWGLYDITGQMKKTGKCPFNDMIALETPRARDSFRDIAAYRSTVNKLDSISEIFSFCAKMVANIDSFSMTAEDNLVGIAEFASSCRTMEELELLIEQIQKPRQLAEGERAISLSTIHGSKGLEAQVVFLTGASNNMLPHKFGLPEEELNLFYVGVTRAIETLYISSFQTFGKNEYIGHSYIDILA